MASSTTMPIASTRPNSVRLFSVKPSAAMTAKVPIERHRHVDHRQDHGPPVLQEHQHDDGHQDDRVAQRVEDLVDRLADERRGVVDDLVIQPVGEARLQLLHLGVDAVGGVQRVGAGQLVDRQRHRRLAVERAGLVVLLRPQLDAGHVAQPDDAGGLRRRSAAEPADRRSGRWPLEPAARPVPAGRGRLRQRVARAGLDDDVGELLGVGEPAQGVDRELELLALAGRAAGRSGRRRPARSAGLMAVTTSMALRLSAASLSGSSQARRL